MDEHGGGHSRTARSRADLPRPRAARSHRSATASDGDRERRSVALFTSRGWWCPKEQSFLRALTALQDEFEVAYSKLVVISVDPPEVQAAFRAGLGARFLFLSDAARTWLDTLGLRETTDTVHHPYRPAAFTLFPDLRIHRAYNGYWFWGRPTAEELRRDMREISMQVRSDWVVT